ncbi:DNA-binding domain-containing protein [uncultured Paraglaciecola sp.]|uniref:HvfC/BufC N-terminal domain-containing protein n=1 Tax=uncultured Paraglaciecola sp. TaxID=1765024 RepID=UPI0025D8D18E|nr:DNA-binding domain-containing protein [uncultured Paraglaciecola sp.]
MPNTKQAITPSLAALQQEFMSLLQTNDRQIEQRVIQQGLLNSAQRVDIYRTGYRIRLRGVIDSDHEILGLYLGDDLYEKMVEGYIDAAPSEHPSLRFFADRLPQYLQNTLPFSDHPILAEIASFERTLLNAFDSADANTLNQELLQHIPADKWPLLKFSFHPSLIFCQCHWNAVESWQNLKNGEAPSPPESSKQSKMWAIWRGLSKLTEYKSILAIEREVLGFMQQGKNFADVCESLIQHVPEEQVAATLYGYIVEWLQRGWIMDASWDS